MGSHYINDLQVDSYLKNQVLLQRYKFIRNLQSGSFGNVSLNLDLTTNDLVCLKLVQLQPLHENKSVTPEVIPSNSNSITPSKPGSLTIVNQDHQITNDAGIIGIVNDNDNNDNNDNDNDNDHNDNDNDDDDINDNKDNNNATLTGTSNVVLGGNKVPEIVNGNDNHNGKGNVSDNFNGNGHLNDLCNETSVDDLNHQAPTSLSIAKQEINILSKLSHKNICNLLNYYYSPNYTIIILEYCQNGDLYDMIHQNQLSAEQIHKLAIQITDALNYCHKLNIYHRDIKPENILIDENFNFKLCDWGLSINNRYSNQFNIGTNKYLAPECYQNFHPDLNYYDCKKSDYWSFGITLLTTIYGSTPFKNNILQDANFKIFKNQANILLDIYPTMNLKTFDIFLNYLLIINNDDDNLSDLIKKVNLRNLNEFLEKFVQINDFNIEEFQDLDVQDVFEQQFDRDFSLASKNLDIFDTNIQQFNSLNSSINSNYLIDDKFYKDINNIWESMKKDKINFDFDDDFKIASWAD